MPGKFGFADLIVPLYIDSETVLGLLGRVEGGIDVSTSVTIERGSSRRRTSGSSVDGGVAPSGFPIFKINGKLSHERAKDDTNNEQWQYERTDTIGSLLQRLRTALLDEGLLSAVGDSLSYEKLGAGEFVEFSGTFIAHPLVQAIDTAQRLMSLFETFVAGQANPNQGKSKKGGAQGGRDALPSNVSPGLAKLFPGADMSELADQLPILQHINRQLLGPLRDELITGVSQTYIVAAPDSDYRAVVTLLDDFVRNIEADEMVGREYRVLGKIVGNATDSSDGIGLLRGSSLALFEDKIQPFADQAAKKIGFPSIETTVIGPVLEIVPIAVYV